MKVRNYEKKNWLVGVVAKKSFDDCQAELGG
jgi:hypothetical protein